MHFGKDFWKTLKFIIMVLKLAAQIFGDGDGNTDGKDELPIQHNGGTI